MFKTYFQAEYEKPPQESSLRNAQRQIMSVQNDKESSEEDEAEIYGWKSIIADSMGIRMNKVRKLQKAKNQELNAQLAEQM